MIAIILAAGLSKRLRPLTNEIPKCLLPLGETTILGRHLAMLDTAGIKQTIIVTGFNAPAVAAEVASHRLTMEVTCVFNNDFADSHPIESFLLTESYISDNFLLLNSDVYFTPSILQAIIDHPHSCVAVDSSAAFIADEMFVNFTPDGVVTAISKQLTPKPHGQGRSVQITKFLQTDAASIFTRAKELSGNIGAFYPAQAFDTIIAQKQFFVSDVAGEFSHEIDTVEDYNSVRHILGYE